MLISVGALALDAALCAGLIPRYGTAGAAAASSAAMLAALCAAGIYLRARFGPCLPVRSAVRVGAAGALVHALSRLLPASGPALVAKFALLCPLYLLALLLLREADARDLSRLRAVIGRRSGGGAV